MAIQLTESAAKQIRTQLAKRGSGIGLRLGIKKVGCSGWTYVFDFADEVRPEDATFEAHEAKLVIDAESLAAIDGAVLDFRKEGLREAFKVENPNVEATCGCGESFSVKEKA
jgi:iron-sulfur cluster assembly protein